MIQDIAPHTYDPVFRNKEPEDRDYVLHYEYNKVMLMRQGDGMALPTFEDLKEDARGIKSGAQYLFSIDDRAYYCVTAVSYTHLDVYKRQVQWPAGPWPA